MSTRLTVDQALRRAVEAHRSGRLREAEQLYRSVLSVHEKHPEANCYYGLLAVDASKPAQALPFFRAAIEARPRDELSWTGYVGALVDTRDLSGARESLQRASLAGLSREALQPLEEMLDDFDRLDAFSPVENLAAEDISYHKNILSLRRSEYIGFPMHVHLETYAKCNAACDFCSYPALERKGVRMSDGLIDKIITDLCDIPRHLSFQLSPFKVSEPFLDSRLFDLLDDVERRLPNAKIMLTSNSTPITEKKLLDLSRYRNIDHLWISFNDHRREHYEKSMRLPYGRTIQRLDLIHRIKASGAFKPRVVLSRVGNGSPADGEFVAWVKGTYPLFDAFVFPRGDWLGRAGGAGSSMVPNVGCVRWFELSIMATGVVAHCCMDGLGEFAIGDVNSDHVLDVYNSQDFRRLREAAASRLEVSPCRSCGFK